VRLELQRLVFFDFGRKKFRRLPGLFFALFRAFLRGVLEKVRFLGGVFVVKAWWIWGELWPMERTLNRG
jgi:hypothetical protein